ncbi:MAG: hypothetical protein KME43_21350 [Myxacorys chilensis ATA2-1-KO14]|jgi:hypothetical protein|nr:hypothetical protein [Myxacorys chilensis ATA2-1-KO14]
MSNNLKLCLDCGTMVSPKAESCPKCGRRHPAGTPATYGAVQILVGIFGVLVVLGMISLMLQPSEKELQYKRFADQGEANLQRIGEAARRAQENP